ncbi:hypothetical protein GCM10027161_29220 [Microbispora hainanensis]
MTATMKTTHAVRLRMARSLAGTGRSRHPPVVGRTRTQTGVRPARAVLRRRQPENTAGRTTPLMPEDARGCRPDPYVARLRMLRRDVDQARAEDLRITCRCDGAGAA